VVSYLPGVDSIDGIYREVYPASTGRPAIKYPILQVPCNTLSISFLFLVIQAIL
jgi:hypothetical protein